MRWSYCVASIALFTPGWALGQPAPPAHPVLTWKKDHLVLTSSSVPDQACKPAPVPGQAKHYTFSPSMDCLDKLDRARLGITEHEISVKLDGTYWQGQTKLKPKAVFNQAGNKIDPQKITDQGPFLFVIDDKTFVQTKELTKAAAA